MRSEGRYFCPACFCMRDFVLAYGASEAEALPDLECSECEYVFTSVTVERHGGAPVTSHTITKEMRQAAKAQLLADFRAQLDANGLDREIVTQGRLRRGR